MVEPDGGPGILWDALALSASIIPGGRGISVAAQFKAKKKRDDVYGVYRLSFELGRRQNLAFYEVEILVLAGDTGQPVWVHSTRRDLVLAVRDHFLKRQLYAHMARQLGWF
jgi:hypothetical protein